jgi:intraflagellar transport protein 56
MQSIVAGKEPRDGLKDLLAMLRNSQQPEMEQIARVIRSWGQQSGAL